MTSPLPHVLVAEDNTLVADAMRLLFEETGHRVTTAGTIADVVRVATEHPVDLLLLDLGLADGDGLDVLDQLRAREAMPRVSVALTGRDEPDVIARCRAAGSSPAFGSSARTSRSSPCFPVRARTGPVLRR